MHNECHHTPIEVLALNDKGAHAYQPNAKLTDDEERAKNGSIETVGRARSSSFGPVFLDDGFLISKWKQTCRQYREQTSQPPNPNRAHDNIEDGVHGIARCEVYPLEKKAQRPNDWIEKNRPPTMTLTAEAAEEHQKTPNQIHASQPTSELWKTTLHSGLT